MSVGASLLGRLCVYHRGIIRRIAMKYRVLVGIIGASMLMTALSGCEKANVEETTEKQTIEIAGMEILDETETEEASASEIVTEEETLSLELDLENETGDTKKAGVSETMPDSESETVPESEPLMENHTEAAEENVKAKDYQTKKPGEPETMTEKKSESETQKQTVKATEPETQKQTVRMTESETQRQTAKETEPETQKQTVRMTESETQRQTVKETEPETQKQTVRVTESETQRQTVKETEPETQKQTVRMTESETQRQTAKETEPETQKQTVRETEPETQKQTVKENESETETEAVRETETEPETESRTEIGVVVINDRVNVRMEPSTEAEITALLTCGMKVVRAESDGEWSKISYESENGLTEGYVKDEFLSPFEALYFAKETVNVRAEATTESDKIGGLDERQSVILEESLDNGWSKIRFMSGSEVKTAFVKSEFLSQADASSISGVLKDVVERISSESIEQNTVKNETEPESESEVESESETETESETEPQSEGQTGVQTEERIMVVNNRVNVRLEPSTDSDAAALLTFGVKVTVTDSDGEWSKIRFETETGLKDGYVKTEFLDSSDMLYTAKEQVNLRAEATTESDKVGELKADEKVIVEESLDNGWSQIRVMKDNEVKTAFVKTEFIASSDSVGESPAAETETETMSETENATETLLSSDEKGQFELVKMLFPEVQSVGIIYSAENKNSEKQLASYEKLAAEYGMSVSSSEIENEIDIDLAASELVGSVDCIFCIDDEMVTPLVQTIRAYADEMEIPVIGISKSHVEQGCVAAYLEDGLHLNTEEAGKLGLDVSGMSFGEITEH